MDYLGRIGRRAGRNPPAWKWLCRNALGGLGALGG
jgi:hypothetical protein